MVQIFVIMIKSISNIHKYLIYLYEFKIIKIIRRSYRGRYN